MSEENKNTGLKITLGILALLLIGASVMFFLKNNELNETKTALNSEISVLGDKLESNIEELNLKISENEVLNVDLIAKRDSLNNTLNELRASQATVENLTKYKNSYFKLKKDIKKLLVDNEELQVQNTRLTQVNDTLVGQLDTQVKLSDSLNIQVEDAQKIILSASELSVAALKGVAVIQKSSGKQIPTTKARRADKVKVCFSVAENKIAPSGGKTLYVQVLDANNNVLGENAQTELDGKTLNYSFKTTFHYTNKVLDICEFLQAPKKGFDKGNYFVNVFRDSKLISNTSFTLE
jgi:CHASE3 domain sensor protein